jgi:5'-deoxy-5'-methylthioadenosine phosphorylase
MLAIIGGSGLAKLADLQHIERKVVRTPYGDPSCPLTFGTLAATQIVFLARHGYGHTIAPHEINYRANLWALQSVGVTQIVAVAAVGGIQAHLGPGSLCVPNQIIDYTYSRKHTFFEGSDQPVTHIDFTHPYDEAIRQRLLQASNSADIRVQDGGVYGTTQGPRLESAAEVVRMQRDGCDLVGMTGMPEAALARELELSYACLAVVVNHAAGVGSSAGKVSIEDINETLGDAMKKVNQVLRALLA